MRVITFGNDKGGVGKTSATVTVGAGLAQRGHKVVVIDTSSQGNCASAFGLNKEPGLYELLVRGVDWQRLLRVVPPEKILCPGETLGQLTGKLYLLPGNHETRNIATSTTDGFILLRRILQLQSAVDFVLIDTPPEPSLLHTLVFAATGEYVYVTKAEQWSLDGLQDSFARLQEFNPMRVSKGLEAVSILGILPTMVEHTVEHDINLEWLREHFPDLVMPVISKRIAWAEAAGQRCSLFSHEPNSVAADEAWELIDQIEAGGIHARQQA